MSKVDVLLQQSTKTSQFMMSQNTLSDNSPRKVLVIPWLQKFSSLPIEIKKSCFSSAPTDVCVCLYVCIHAYIYVCIYVHHGSFERSSDTSIFPDPPIVLSIPDLMLLQLWCLQERVVSHEHIPHVFKHCLPLRFQRRQLVFTLNAAGIPGNWIR